MKVAIVYKEDSKDLANRVANFISERGVSFSLYNKPYKDIEKAKIVITIGGDGTILQTLQKLEKPPPIFGINTGRVGLLTHATPENFENELEKTLNNELNIEEFMRIETRVGDERLIALNEISLLSRSPAKLIGINVHVDNQKVEDLRADGIIISTPIGSTAYSLSSGGPVVDPYLNSILIVPVSPFKLGWKPWVVSSERKITVEVSMRDGVVVADGQKMVDIREGERFEVKKSKYSARFFEIPNRLERISKKLREIR